MLFFGQFFYKKRQKTMFARSLFRSVNLASKLPALSAASEALAARAAPFASARFLQQSAPVCNIYDV